MYPNMFWTDINAHKEELELGRSDTIKYVNVQKILYYTWGSSIH